MDDWRMRGEASNIDEVFVEIKTVSYTHLDVYKRQVLREVGSILRTYCHHQQKKWQEYLAATKEFLNLAHYPAIGITPYSAMYETRGNFFPNNIYFPVL